MITGQQSVVAVFVFTFLAMSTARASTDTIGPNGINSAGLRDFNGVLLTGASVDIGQVEPFRPGKPGIDNGVTCCNADVVPTATFVRNVVAGANQAIDDHAIAVAGVLISTASTAPVGHLPPAGVAIGAALYSGATQAVGTDQTNASLTLENIATIANVPVINMSFGMDLEAGKTAPDGNSLMTLFMDWSASQHDILYVKSGNEVGPAGPVGSDNYNGITVAMSKKNDTDGKFREVSLVNVYSSGVDPIGPRTATDILAPGVQLDVAGANGVFLTPTSMPINSGTSYAAPHVAGTVALLQQYGNERILNGGWNATARRHEVMKVVLMNSADKIQDDGMGHMLGMDRTVLDQQGHDWLASEAYHDIPLSSGRTIPLDDQMGAGELDAKRALQQYKAGQYTAGGSPVPAVGWDLGTTQGFADIQKYVLAQPIRVDQFVSITLAWDRQVFLDSDVNSNGIYDPGDTFLQDAAPIDLNLYLMPLGATSLDDAEAESVAIDSSVEHIFFKTELSSRQYEIWVEQASGSDFSTQEYGLAWWTLPISNPASTGDYNGSGTIDSGDFNIWKNNFGSTTNLAADGNGNGIIDAGDYTIWRDHLGQTISGSGGMAAVPEPASIGLVLAGVLGLMGIRRSTVATVNA